MNNFRKLTLQKLAGQLQVSSSVSPNQPDVNPEIRKRSGKLTDLVKKQLGEPVTSFKEAFLKLPPGPKREDLVYQEVIKRNLKAKLVPVTVDGPNGIKITYKVMPDYITIDGIRVPMAGKTAQKVANHFGMVLPTDKMSDQIWEAADVKIRPPPLSGAGYRDRSGRYYSGKDVVRSKIGDPEAALAYSEQIEKAIQDKGGGELVAGHMKDVIMPYNTKSLGLYGWRGEKGDTIQTSPQTPHDTVVHTEYGSGTRLADDKVDVTLPSGKVIKTTMKEVMNHPELYKSVSNFRGIREYD